MAPVNPAIDWLREPLRADLSLRWRLRAYAASELAVLVSVPFLHLYLSVDLTAAELAIHTLDIGFGALLVLGLFEAGISLWQRSLRWNLALSRAALMAGVTAVAAGLFLLQANLHDVLPVTARIRAKHVDAGYGDMSLRVLPLVLLMGWVVGQGLREQALRRELEELRTLNARLARLRPRRAGDLPQPADDVPRLAGTGGGASAGDRVAFRHEGGDLLLETRAITRIQAEENYCRIHATAPGANEERSWLVRTTLAETLARLPAARFLQVHRSHVVGLAHVSEVRREGRRYSLRVGTDAWVPVSRGRVADVRAHVVAGLEG
jgi:hypothetical protein